MIFRKKISLLIWLIAISSCYDIRAQYLGGIGDGVGFDADCSTTLDGVGGGGLSISSISGPSSFCNNDTETYSVQVINGSAESFLWTGPNGSSIISQQIDGYVKLQLGTDIGNVTVKASNSCMSVTEVFGVSNMECNYYYGGIGDGFAMGDSEEIVLPITLSSFSVTYEEPYAYINWRTESEINNDLFIIEKSLNTEDWQEVVNVSGAGNYIGALNYSEVDEDPFSGISYYRLKQIDFDGAFSYSELEVLRRISNNENLLVYPNPSNELVNIKGYLSKFTKISVYDINGMLHNVPVSNSDETFTLNIFNLSSGIYYVRIYDNGTYQNEKIVIN